MCIVVDSGVYTMIRCLFIRREYVMNRQEAEALLSTLRTYEFACAADMEREWCEAKYIADMCDYDETHV